MLLFPRPVFFLWLLAAVLWPLLSVVSAQPYVVGQSYFGRNNYIEYRPGDLPVILTTGHGGSLYPAEIPDRSGTDIVTVTDTNTREMAIACVAEIYARTGHRPHLIINHLARLKLDPNREIEAGALGNVYAEQAWTEFHGYIAAAREATRAGFGFGFLVDIHGHGHDIARLELGYALGAPELNQTDTVLNNPGYTWMSTLRTLLLARPGTAFPDLLRGPRSLGTLFNLRGVPAWPSSDYPSPGTASFFNGGYIVRTHTCILDNSTVHGVQIESHYTGIRDSAASRSDFAARFANVLEPYLWDNYGYDLGTLSLARIDAPPGLVLARGGAARTITVRRSGYLALSSTLPVSFGGSAVRGAGGDYTTSITSSVSFSANQAVATFTLTPAALGSAFGDKTLSIALAPSATQTADTAPVVFTLGDGVSQNVRAAALADSVPEAAGAAVFRLTRTQSAGNLTVPLSWSGNALPGADYYDAPASATFASGSTTVDVAVPLVNDGRAGPDKTLTLGLGTGSTYAVGNPASATVTIVDDDRPAGLALWLRGDLSGNTVNDSSGLGRHATSLPANGPLAAGPAQLSASTSAGDVPAIDFDGSDDTVALPRFTFDPAGAFTLAFYFRLDPGGTIANQNLAALGTRSAAGSLHLYLATTNTTNGTVSLRTNLPGLAASALDVGRTSPSTWQDSVWRHYALSVAADGTAGVYIDGVLRKSASGRSGTLDANELLWLGWRPNEGNVAGFMDGALRDIRVYRRALPAAEIAALSAARLTFAAWLSANGLDPAQSATADPDGNGLSSFLEYAFGAGPSSPGLPRYSTGLSGGRLTLSFLRESAASDLRWIVEGSDTLSSTWQTLALRTATGSAWTILTGDVSVVENNDQVVVTDSAELSARPARFLRLRAERVP